MVRNGAPLEPNSLCIEHSVVLLHKMLIRLRPTAALWLSA